MQKLCHCTSLLAEKSAPANKKTEQSTHTEHLSINTLFNMCVTGKSSSGCLSLLFLPQQVVFCKHLEFREQTDLIMAEPELSSPADPSLRSPRSAPLSLSFPFLREGSRVWERAALQPGELPSPLPTKRTRTYSA